MTDSLGGAGCSDIIEEINEQNRICENHLETFNETEKNRAYRTEIPSVQVQQIRFFTCSIEFYYVKDDRRHRKRNYNCRI